MVIVERLNHIGFERSIALTIERLTNELTIELTIELFRVGGEVGVWVISLVLWRRALRLSRPCRCMALLGLFGLLGLVPLGLFGLAGMLVDLAGIHVIHTSIHTYMPYIPTYIQGMACIMIVCM